jgi:hypothetical protein
MLRVKRETMPNAGLMINGGGGGDVEETGGVSNPSELESRTAMG